MVTETKNTTKRAGRIVVTEEVEAYITERGCNFRVCTTCGGPVLLSTDVKPPKPNDLELYVGDQILYVSVYQAPYIDRIDMDMVPRYCYY